MEKEDNKSRGKYFWIMIFGIILLVMGYSIEETYGPNGPTGQTHVRDILLTVGIIMAFGAGGTFFFWNKL
ncbi:MAG: hypothetical protein HY606_05070 [Planctomycetes bacterium]|nr:hypothetical protein [Planctomycetota bacterium]